MKREVFLFAFICFFVLLFVFSNFAVAEEEKNFFEKYFSPIFSPFNASVTISPDNTAPVLGRPIGPEIFVCEGDSFSYIVNATDSDADETLTWSIGDLGPFFYRERGEQQVPEGTYEEMEIYSGFLQKEYVGVHEKIVFVNDGELADSEQMNITVIEINNWPHIEEIENRTIDLDETNTLYIEINANDSESGNQTSGNLTFNLTFLSGEEIFGISEFGVINYTFDSSHVGDYKVEICVEDNGLSPGAIHQNISLCGIGAAENKSACTDLNLSITEDVIIIPPSGGGGGGGGGFERCEVNWGCYDWSICLEADESLRRGELSGDVYRDTKETCDGAGFGGDRCGVQTRGCFDINSCNKNRDVPSDMQACHFSLDPTCFDSIRNCHDDSCEFLIDCGGPCEACGTCSDGIQNQGEGGIDCGGSCPSACAAELPSTTGGIRLNFGSISTIVVSIVILVLVFVAVIKVKNILKLRRANK